MTDVRSRVWRWITGLGLAGAVGLYLAACSDSGTLREAEPIATSSLAVESANDPVPCSAWGAAVVANTGAVTLDAKSIVDSYASAVGPYGGRNVGTAGTIIAGTSVVGNGGVEQGHPFPRSPSNLAVAPVPPTATRLI